MCQLLCFLCAPQTCAILKMGKVIAEGFITSRIHFVFLLFFQLRKFSGIVCFWNPYNDQDFRSNFPSEGPCLVCPTCAIAVEKSSGFWAAPKFPIPLWIEALKVPRIFLIFAQDYELGQSTGPGGARCLGNTQLKGIYFPEPFWPLSKPL